MALTASRKRTLLAVSSHSHEPPVHLLLGSDALKLVQDKLAAMAREIDRWEDLIRSTDGA